MKRTVKILALLITVGLAGCMPTTLNKMNKVSIGMSKQEVITAIGSPTETRATAGVEYLMYHLRVDTDVRYSKVPYFVQIEKGRVIAYGKMGDFGSTQVPESTVNINKTVKKVD